MKRWPTKPLAELVLPTEQRDPRENPTAEFFYVDIASVNNETKNIASTSKTIGANAPSRARKVIRKGDVIVSTVRPNLNAVALVPSTLDNQICSTGFSVLRPSEKILSGYLFAFARSPSFIDYLVARTTGANYPAVNDGEVKDIPIPLPPLVEQERIVKLLDEADELRKLRAQADHRTAALIPALFHEMFGDPATNPKGWPSKRLGETAIINPKLPREKLLADEKEFSFVPMAAVDEILGVISSSETRRYSEVSKGYTPFQNGDVLFAKITPCMQNGKSAIAENLVGGLGFGSTEFHVLRPTDVVTSEYIFWLIRRPTFRSQAEQNFTGTAGQQRVPTSFIENYPCPVPPLPLQREFAQRVTEIRALETAQAASHRHLDDLFQSVLHRAFAGEL